MSARRESFMTRRAAQRGNMDEPTDRVATSHPVLGF
jgi:hypothetical protein